MYKIAFATLTALTLAAPSLAETAGGSAVLDMDTVLGTTSESVTAALTDMGYEVRKSEMEDGKIEVYFVGHGKMGEVYVSPGPANPPNLRSSEHVMASIDITQSGHESAREVRSGIRWSA